MHVPRRRVGTGIVDVSIVTPRIIFAALTGAIVWNVVMISLADVNKKNLLESLAQFCSRVEVGSPPVSTWTV